jgi:hypothetical protein
MSIRSLFTRLGSRAFAVLMVLALLSAALPPASAFAASVTPKFTLEKVGTRLTVTVEDAQKSSTYYVKVDDANKSGYTWSKIGVLETDKYSDGEDTFTLPTTLRKVTDFNVCLKNTQNDDLLCSVSILTVIRSSEDEDEDEASADAGTFKVTRDGDYVTIKTTAFPTKTAYFVKAAKKTAGSPTWYMLGDLKTKSSSSKSYTYKLPKQLRDVDDLNVCLKNSVTNKLSCVLNLNPH